MNFLNRYKSFFINAFFISSALALMVCMFIYSTSIYIESEASAIKGNLAGVSKEIANQIHSKMTRAFEINRFNKNILKVSVQQGKDLKMSRSQAIALLNEQLTDNEDFLGLYTVWEPNAFDNQDAHFKNKPFHDSTGRFIPYIVRSGTSIMIEPLKFYEQEGIGNYYLLPKSKKQEVIINPYTYPINGKEVMMVSAITPIIINGKFMGMTGTDFTVDYIQEVIRNNKLLDHEAYTMIIASNDIVVAMEGHPEYIGKRINELPVDLQKVFENQNKDFIQAFSFIELGNTNTPWKIAISVPKSIVTKKAIEASWRAGLIILFVILIIILIISQNKFKKAAKVSEITLQSIASNVHNSIWAIDNEFKLTFFNQKFKNNIKTIYNVDVNLGESVFHGHGLDEIKFWTPIYDRALTGEQKNLDIYRGGRSFEFSFYPISEKDINIGVFIISTEVTEKINTQKEIKLNEEKYRNLVETSPTTIVIIDYTEGKIIEANQEACKLFKISREEIKLLGPAQLSPEFQEDGTPSSILAQEYMARAAKGEDLIFDWTHMDSEGKLIPAQVWLSKFPSNDKILLRGTVLNITERKKHQEELQSYIDFQSALIEKVKEQEASLSSLINSSTDFIFSIDTHLNITEYNNAFKDEVKKIFGIDLRKGQSIKKLKFSEETIERIIEALSGKTVKKIVEYSHGEIIRYFDSIYSPIFSENNQVIGVTAMTRDVTESKLAEKKLVEINKQIAEYKLVALRSAMNPHFLFNSLNSIQYFVAKNERKLALDYLSIFSSLIRKILNSSVNHVIPLKTELEILNNYILLEKLRFEEKFDYSIDVDPEIETEDINIPSLLIQPFVENAIIHGLMNKKETGYLSIKVKLEDDHLLFIVKDNGIGRAKAQEIKTSSSISEKSYGIILTQERLEIINRTAKVSVMIEDLINTNQEPEGTSVTISIKI